MSSNPNRPKARKQLSKADLKAYEARRAAERRRISTASPNPLGPTEPAHIPVEHPFTMSRDDEYTVIKADLIRLLMILAALVVVLVVLTFVLR